VVLISIIFSGLLSIRGAGEDRVGRAAPRRFIRGTTATEISGRGTDACTRPLNPLARYLASTRAASATDKRPLRARFEMRAARILQCRFRAGSDGPIRTARVTHA